MDGPKTMKPNAPNHALQRTATAVTARAHSATTFPPPRHEPRQPPPSLSLGSLGASALQPNRNPKQTTMKQITLITTAFTLFAFAACNKPTTAHADSNDTKQPTQSSAVTTAQLAAQFRKELLGTWQDDTATQFFREDNTFDTKFSNGLNMLGGTWRIDDNAHLFLKFPKSEKESDIGLIKKMTADAVFFDKGKGQEPGFKRINAEQSRMVFNSKFELVTEEAPPTPLPAASPETIRKGLPGIWRDVESGETLTFRDDHTLDIKTEDGTDLQGVSWRIDDNGNLIEKAPKGNREVTIGVIQGMSGEKFRLLNVRGHTGTYKRTSK